MSKIREKESLECVRMHIWVSKTQKLPGPLSGPWTPAAECSLRSLDSASLRWQLLASEAGAPPLTKSWIRTWFSTKLMSDYKKGNKRKEVVDRNVNYMLLVMYKKTRFCWLVLTGYIVQCRVGNTFSDLEAVFFFKMRKEGTVFPLTVQKLRS